MRASATTHARPWQVDLVPRAGTILRQTSALIATADSGILDAAVRWYDLATAVVERYVPDAWYLDLNVPPAMVEV